METVGVRVSPREKECLEQAATDAGLTVSDYLRAGGMLMAMFDGNRKAVEITADLARDLVKSKVDLAKMAMRRRVFA
jgi:hypothetical protein